MFTFITNPTIDEKRWLTYMTFLKWQDNQNKNLRQYFLFKTTIEKIGWNPYSTHFMSRPYPMDWNDDIEERREWHQEYKAGVIQFVLLTRANVISEHQLTQSMLDNVTMWPAKIRKPFPNSGSSWTNHGVKEVSKDNVYLIELDNMSKQLGN